VNALALEGWNLYASEEAKRAHPNMQQRIKKPAIKGE
jgi:hypothetical protein